MGRGENRNDLLEFTVSLEELADVELGSCGGAVGGDGNVGGVEGGVVDAGGVGRLAMPAGDFVDAGLLYRSPRLSSS